MSNDPPYVDEHRDLCGPVNSRPQVGDARDVDRRMQDTSDQKHYSGDQSRVVRGARHTRNPDYDGIYGKIIRQVSVRPNRTAAPWGYANELTVTIVEYPPDAAGHRPARHKGRKRQELGEYSEAQQYP